MPKRYALVLEAPQRAELVKLRDHARQPYLRERAAVLLAITDGTSIRTAARQAGLKPHDADTVCRWVARYATAGVAGLHIRTGRGRKPAFFRGASPRRGRAHRSA